MSRKRYLIIGDGAAGTTGAETIRRADPDAHIAILSDDPHAAYYRAALTNYLLGELRQEQIFAVPPSFYAEHGIHRVLTRVMAVDTRRSQIWLAQGGRPLDYDYLLFGAGSRARPPSFEGGALPGVMTMRTLQDVQRVMDLVQSKSLKRAVVVGGGPLGLEWAHGLKVRDVAVTMMVREAKFMAASMDAVASDLLAARIKQSGVDLRIGDEVQSAYPGPDGRLAGIVTKSGARIECGLLAMGIGVLCNTEPLAKSDVTLGKTGAVVVDATMRTSVDNVYAAGDIVEWDGRLLQLWEPARRQGKIAGLRMAGRAEGTYAPGAHYNATRVYDLDFAAIGQSASMPSGAQEYVDFPRRTGRISYKKLYVKDGKLVGALALGERDERVRLRGRLWKILIDEQIDVSGVAADLLDPAFDLKGFLDQRVLASRPEAAPAAGAVPSAAKLKGTQAVAIGDVGALLAQMQSKSAGKANGGSGAGVAQAAAAAQGMPPGLAGLDTLALPPGKGKKRTEIVPIDLAALAKLSPAAVGASAASSLAAPKARTSMLAMAGAMTGAPARPLASPFYLEGAGRKHEVGDQGATVGRDPRCEIPVTDPAVAWQHVQLTRVAGIMYLRDLGSQGGTWLNGAALVMPLKVVHGDRIRVGQTEFVVATPGRESEARPFPAAVPAADPRRSATAAPIPTLEVRSGQSLGLSFEIARDDTSVGRDPASAVRLDDPSIAWRHAAIRATPEGLAIADLQSPSGTFRGGQRIAPGAWVPIFPDDVLQLGDVRLAYVMRASTYGDLPPSMIGRSLDARAAGPASAMPAVSTPSGYGPPPSAIAGPHARGRVSIRSGPSSGSMAELGPQTIIGSLLGQVHLPIPDPHVAPRHLEITQLQDGFYARDLGTPTGSWKSGVRLGPQPVRLAHGDQLQLGPHVTLLFEGA